MRTERQQDRVGAELSDDSEDTAAAAQQLPMKRLLTPARYYMIPLTAVAQLYGCS